MRIAPARRPVAAGLSKSLPNPILGKFGLPAILATGLLAGCAADVPLPDSALLEQLQAPRCEYRKAGSKKADGATSDNQDLQVKLDYERQCYRHAEMIARARLKSLQKSVSRTVVALRAEQAALGRPQQQMVGP
jgi:hypothetical protein